MPPDFLSLSDFRLFAYESIFEKTPVSLDLNSPLKNEKYLLVTLQRCKFDHDFDFWPCGMDGTLELTSDSHSRLRLYSVSQCLLPSEWF